MIKILIEEPIIYQDIRDGDLAWIYKNPTKKEIEELIDEYDSQIRGLIHNKDIYVASASYFVHNSIAGHLLPITKLNIKQYDNQFYVDGNKNEIIIYYKIKDLNIFKDNLITLLNSGLINNKTIIYTEEAFEVEDKDYPTVEEFLNL